MKADKVHHRITINLSTLGDGRRAAIPSLVRDLCVGHTLSYSSPHGRFRVEFMDGSPFGESGPAAVTDARLLTLVEAGRLDSRCFLILPDGTEIGWSAETPESGGAQDVRPRAK